jgi:hypothetical protein
MKALAFAALLALTSPAAAQDITGRATVIVTAREITDALIADKAPQATRKQADRPASGYPCGVAEA